VSILGDSLSKFARTDRNLAARLVMKCHRAGIMSGNPGRVIREGCAFPTGMVHGGTTSGSGKHAQWKEGPISPPPEHAVRHQGTRSRWGRANAPDERTAWGGEFMAEWAGPSSGPALVGGSQDSDTWWVLGPLAGIAEVQSVWRGVSIGLVDGAGTLVHQHPASYPVPEPSHWRPPSRHTFTDDTRLACPPTSGMAAAIPCG
jgi:hypothetical protein